MIPTSVTRVSCQNVTDYRRTKGMLKTEIDFNERITTEGPS